MKERRIAAGLRTQSKGVITFPGALAPAQWQFNQARSLYRCGGSVGFAPTSRFTPSVWMGHRNADGSIGACVPFPCFHNLTNFDMSQSTELAAAIAAARAAGDIIRSAYRTQVAVEIKADASPVTEVDVACEHRIREILSDACPGYGFYGEETGQSDMDSEFVWLVDPLDGTKSFVRGYPFISTQIALMRGEDLVLGVSAAPLFDELAWAEIGQGAWLNNDRLRVSEVSDWSQATLSTGNIGSLAASATRWKAFGALVPQLHRIRGYGDFYHYHLLSAGRIDAVLESDLNILDIAANTVILREAGGVVTDLDGQAIGLSTRSTVAGNAILQPRLLELMQG